MAGLSTILSDIRVMTSDLTDPKAKSARLAEFAAGEIAKVTAANKSITGRENAYQVAVDGKLGAALATVKPDGVIVANFDLILAVLEWIGEQLLFESPRRSGRYMRSHIMLVDDVEHDIDEAIPNGREYVFANTQPYARKIEGGFGPSRDSAPQSAQAPEGVYQGVAVVAQKRFGNMAKIFYGVRQLTGGSEGRQPAIIVRPL